MASMLEINWKPIINLFLCAEVEINIPKYKKYIRKIFISFLEASLHTLILQYVRKQSKLKTVPLEPMSNPTRNPKQFIKQIILGKIFVFYIQTDLETLHLRFCHSFLVVSFMYRGRYFSNYQHQCARSEFLRIFLHKTSISLTLISLALNSLQY